MSAHVSIITYMSYDENERSTVETFLRETIGEEIPIMQEGILTKALIISEWLTPNGKRYLTRSPVGELTDWDIQGFCMSTLASSNADWESSEDDEIEEE